MSAKNTEKPAEKSTESQEPEKTIQHKAREINQSGMFYGAFAEIGAGQEVARHFFQAGLASQTIAKTISAYDMIYSYEIYGKEKSGRYVCESRLNKMLDKEYSLLQRRLNATRGDKTCFFAFANTVATGDQKKKYSHGWMGLRFQTAPNREPNDIILHVRLLDKYRLQQQECLGALGVNLVHTGLTRIKKKERILECLTENIKLGQISIDYIEFKGPDLAHINNQMINLELVKRKLSDAVLFTPDFKVTNFNDEFYQKPLLILRGRFNPFQAKHEKIIAQGRALYEKSFKLGKDKKYNLVCELSMDSNQNDKPTSVEDFYKRVKSVTSNGQYVLVTHYHLFYQLKHFLRQYTQSPVGLLLSAAMLPRLMDQSHYADLDGGLLEGLGKLLDTETKLLIFPSVDKKDIQSIKEFRLNDERDQIFDYFRKQSQILDL